ncbi:MAG: TonB-dependent receptor [Pseudomonadota bacterium]
MRMNTQLSLIALAVASATQSIANAQDKNADTQVVVVTGIAGSVESALSQKKRATNMVEAITAEDMGKFPDLNLSESLQRVPGVTLERNNVGDGSAINLRGLGPQFTIVTVNGMEGVSSGTDSNFGLSNGSRGFNFEILPSELFTNATVNKSSSATQIEGGMAGVVELETARPLDQKGFRFISSAKGNYSDKSGKVDPRATVIVSNNWDHVFGMSAALTTADTTFRSDTAQGGSYRNFGAVNTGTRASDAIRAAIVANGPRYIYYADQRKTLGATTTAQWQPSRELDVTADVLYGKLSSKRNDTRDDAAIEGGVNIPVSTVIESGLITAGQFTGVQQRVGTNYLTTEEKLRQFTLQGRWRPVDDWTIRPFLGSARREAQRSWDLYSFRLAKNGAFDPGIVSYQIRGDQLDFKTTDTDFSSNPNDFLFNVFVARPSTDTDREHTAKLDFEREFDGSVLTNLKFGVRQSRHDKDTVQSQWRLNRAAGVGIGVPPTLGSVYGNVDFNVAGGGSAIPASLLIANPALIAATYFPGGAPVAGTVRADLVAYGAQNSYSISEDTNNAYLSGTFESHGATVDAGLRYVRTRQTSSGYTVENANLPTQRITLLSISTTYSKVLPSANLRYAFAPSGLLRAAYSQTLTRPDLNQLAPSETVNGIDQSGGKGSRGNPLLQPFKSTNYDLGAEWYMDKAAMVGLSVFRKDIDGFIDTTTFTETRSFPRQADGVIVSGPIIFTQPVNGVSAKINGAEFIVQSRFTFLPAGWLRNLGGIFNYSYTKSSANFSQVNDVRSAGLPGLSKNSYNASIYYDDGAFEGRASYAWRGKYLAQFSDDFGIPRFRNAYGQVDLSAGYKLSKRLTLQLDVLNATRSQFIDKSSDPRYPFGVYDLDRRILAGLRYAM